MHIGKGSLLAAYGGVFSPMLWLTILFQLILCAKHGYTPFLSALFLRGKTPLPNAWFIFALVLLYSFFFIAFRLTKRTKQSIITPSYSLFSLYRHYLSTTLRAGLVGNDSSLSLWEASLYHTFSSVWGVILSIGITFGIISSDIELLLLLPYLVIPIVVIVLINKSGYARWIQSERRADISGVY